MLSLMITLPSYKLCRTNDDFIKLCDICIMSLKSYE